MMRGLVLAAVAAVGMAGQAGAVVLRMDIDTGNMPLVDYRSETGFPNFFAGTTYRYMFSMILDTNCFFNQNLRCDASLPEGIEYYSQGFSWIWNQETYVESIIFTAAIKLGPQEYNDIRIGADGYAIRTLAPRTTGSNTLFTARWSTVNANVTYTEIGPSIPLPATAILLLGGAGALGALRIRRRST